jgi:hypothetical protein
MGTGELNRRNGTERRRAERRRGMPDAARMEVDSLREGIMRSVERVEVLEREQLLQFVRIAQLQTEVDRLKNVLK